MSRFGDSHGFIYQLPVRFPLHLSLSSRLSNMGAFLTWSQLPAYPLVPSASRSPSLSALSGSIASVLSEPSVLLWFTFPVPHFLPLSRSFFIHLLPFLYLIIAVVTLCLAATCYCYDTVLGGKRPFFFSLSLSFFCEYFGPFFL